MWSQHWSNGPMSQCLLLPRLRRPRPICPTRRMSRLSSRQRWASSTSGGSAATSIRSRSQTPCSRPHLPGSHTRPPPQSPRHEAWADKAAWTVATDLAVSAGQLAYDGSGTDHRLLRPFVLSTTGKGRIRVPLTIPALGAGGSGVSAGIAAATAGGASPAGIDSFFGIGLAGDGAVRWVQGSAVGGTSAPVAFASVPAVGTLRDHRHRRRDDQHEPGECALLVGGRQAFHGRPDHGRRDQQPDDRRTTRRRASEMTPSPLVCASTSRRHTTFASRCRWCSTATAAMGRR
jgi:hypothetical protein